MDKFFRLSKKQLKLLYFINGKEFVTLDEICDYLNTDDSGYTVTLMLRKLHPYIEYYASNNRQYHLTEHGHAYIELHKNDLLDRVFTRTIAIIGAVTGVVSLLWHIIESLPTPK